MKYCTRHAKKTCISCIPVQNNQNHENQSTNKIPISSTHTHTLSFTRKVHSKKKKSLKGKRCEQSKKTNLWRIVNAEIHPV